MSGILEFFNYVNVTERSLKLRFIRKRERRLNYARIQTLLSLLRQTDSVGIKCLSSLRQGKPTGAIKMSQM